ncbi:Rieske 2Fe-2S domain-containing protein [Streptomyces sp. NBC_00233]|uniref:Rieske 2Fe-2S domain-containing protein n=1 Tax=Streptomyces sp. NBC_00233 TaxID=2975686 RepID=UPI002254D56D|nr:Rieske 2Fe-2S domain-containing protein [Streptomyces sp. NBC_00233]MCX5233290.1 Rieske 2Fe-2S domain-containing protein [Streptomyces sp. NBC_00233]
MYHAEQPPINTQATRETPPATRRSVLLAGLVTAGVAALASCTRYGQEAGPPSPASSVPALPDPDSSASGETTRPPTQASAGRAIASTADIPVGGGKVIPAEKVVVTQPEPGQFKVFSAICSHAGCAVTSVANGAINCPCHGSKFRITDGSVVQGPAPRPLAPVDVSITDNNIIRA